MDLLWVDPCFLPHHIWFYDIFSKTPWKDCVYTAVTTAGYMDLTWPLIFFLSYFWANEVKNSDV